MLRFLCYTAICITFYSLSTNLFRLQVAGFSTPILVLPLLLLGITRITTTGINKHFLQLSLLFALYASVLIISSMLADAALATSMVGKMLICFLLLWFTYAIARGKTDQQIINFLVGISIASGVLAFLHATYYRVVLQASFLSISFDGIVSEAGKNQLANYLGVLTVLSFALALKPGFSKAVRFLLYLSFISHMVALLYTFSRSALIGAIFIILCYTTIGHKKELKHLLSGPLIPILLGLLFIIASVGVSNDLASEFLSNLSSVVSMSDGDDSTSIAVRSQLINLGLDTFVMHPILGKGPNSFVDMFGVASHNSYVQLLAETGLTGLFTFCLFLLYPIFWRSTTNVRSVLKPALAYFAFSLFFQNALDSLLLFLILGLVSAKSRNESAPLYSIHP